MPNPKLKPAHLVLADGTVFSGRGHGANRIASGEVVFHTGMTGYQEILTDPSYFGQIVVMTYPHIGNTGYVPADDESKRIFASGFVVRDFCEIPSNYRAKQSLPDWLAKNKVPVLSDIDTRMLVRHLRKSGAMPAIIAIGNSKSIAELKKFAKKLPSMDGLALAEKVSTTKPYTFKKGLEDFIKQQPIERGPKSKHRRKVVAYDFGIKTNILRLLTENGCDVTVVPSNYPAAKILADKTIDGVFLSNGPGDPAECHHAIASVKDLLGKKPIFGICLGHQILALALGARTYKLKFGHHGANHPVLDLETNKVEITSQNHGFAVQDSELPAGIELTHINLNDKTVEGIAVPKLKAFSVQYHPEAAPGPQDSRYLFQRFLTAMEN